MCEAGHAVERHNGGAQIYEQTSCLPEEARVMPLFGVLDEGTVSIGVDQPAVNSLCN